MRGFVLHLALASSLSCFTMANAIAAEQAAGSSGGQSGSAISDDPVDPSNALGDIRQRRTQRDSLFGVSPLKSAHDAAAEIKKDIDETDHLELGLMINHVFQGITEALPGNDKHGMTTDLDFVGSWKLAKRDTPTQGKLYFHVEGRWDYGTTGPQNLGFVSLASAIGTANAFSAYTPTFIMRNFYWEQGSQEAGWAFRAGKITPDSILATSRHISPVTTFLPNGGTGLFSSGYPDSGLGVVAVGYPSDRFRILGLVSDANANRYDLGDISAGDFYTAFELGVKFAPRTKKAGFSKFTVWHNDGTKDGKPINASTGLEGWGMTVKLEHEFSDDGQKVGIFRWGKSEDGTSLYNEQVGLHFLFYNPDALDGLQNDLIGVAVNWAEASATGARDEYNTEVFYRFPFFTGLDSTVSYQYVKHPANTREIDHASVFSFRLRAVF
jgi:porin